MLLQVESKNKHKRNKMKRIILITAIFTVFCLSSVLAVAPSDEVIAKWKKEGTYDQNIAILKNFKANGGCAPVEHAQLKDKQSFASSSVIDTVRVLVVLVDFLDNDYTDGTEAGTVADFDSILFSDRTTDAVFNPSGSMTDYYMETSYGKFYVVGDIIGWHTTLYYDTYTNGAYGLDGSARNLADECVVWASQQPGIDFQNYDHNNDGYCDGVVIIHAGPGAETTGSLDDIWSHKWTIPTPRTIDGVIVSNYTMNPEEYGSDLSPIGVFCHEYGHFLGLPDLYDTDDNETYSEGLGRWALMSSGNYLGSSKYPAHFCAWSKSQLGFVNVVDVGTNLYDVAIPQVESEPVVYKLQSDSSTSQYWLVENRQRVGFDSYLPGEGLHIYHVDDAVSNNNNPFRYKVALEQADGNDALALSGSLGDAGDPWPGFTVNRNFNTFSSPSSLTNYGIISTVGVWNISDPDSLMYADLDVSYSRPWVKFSTADSVVFDDSQGNGDGELDAGETIRFFFTVTNKMRLAHNLTAKLILNIPGVTFSSNDVVISGMFDADNSNNLSLPIEFTLPNELDPAIDSVFLQITSDSTSYGTPGGENYTTILPFEVSFGKPNLIIIDDDRGASYEDDFTLGFYEKRLPSLSWDVNAQGLPTYADLANYDMIFWHTGDTSSTESSIQQEDIDLMKELMDNGKSVMLTTFDGIDDIFSLDSAFLDDYFKAIPAATVQWPIYTGIDGSSIGDGTQYRLFVDKFVYTPTLNVTGAGEAIFKLYNRPEICGVAYNGSYKSVLLPFSLEYIDSYRAGYNTQADMISKVVDFFGGLSTNVYDGNGFPNLPKSFELSQNYPNPFNPTTTIRYTIRSTERLGEKPPKTNLTIYNVLGRKVITLIDDFQVPGTYEVEWDGTDKNDSKVASGIYFYRLTRGEDAVTKKMTLLK